MNGGRFSAFVSLLSIKALTALRIWSALFVMIGNCLRTARATIVAFRELPFSQLATRAWHKLLWHLE